MQMPRGDGRGGGLVFGTKQSACSEAQSFWMLITTVFVVY
jgi:hypothetical protein